VSGYAAIPNFGKVEYFCEKGLTLFCDTVAVLPVGQREAIVANMDRSEFHHAFHNHERRWVLQGSATL
jgi:hypothetical protein